MKFNMNISDSPWPPCSAIFVKRQSPYLKEFTITFIPGKDTEIDYAQKVAQWVAQNTQAVMAIFILQQ